MVRIKRPPRRIVSQRVNKDTDPSISLTAVNSEVGQHGKENAHASTHGINHDLAERCSELCLSTLEGYPAVEEKNHKDAATNQSSKPCDEEADITTMNPNSNTFSNISTDVRLKYYRRKSSKPCDEVADITTRNSNFTTFSNICTDVRLKYYTRERKKKGSILVEHLKYCKRRRKGFFWSGKPLKNYRRRRTGYVSLGTRNQVYAEEASLMSLETMKEQIIRQPGEKLLPEEAPSGGIKKKILVLDINGLLADIVPVAHLSNEHKPDPNTIISGKAVFKRPFCDEFLEFCFERFHVGVWSSRIMKNVDSVLNLLMGKEREKLLFCWDQSKCTCSRYCTPDNEGKPLFFKELNKLWENSKNDLPWKKGDYDESNTLLLDDSPCKALLNPSNTAIFPQTYQYSTEGDSALGPDGDLCTYLEGIFMAPNVQEYVKQNPYGQDPITENHPSWCFYHQVIESTVVGSSRKPYQSWGKDVSQVNNTSVVAETIKECDASIFHQNEKSIPGLLGTACSNVTTTQRGCKRGSISGSHSHSLSAKKCRRSNTTAPSHGSAFGGDKARNYQTFHENRTFKHKSVLGECYAFIHGKCNFGSDCRFLHSVPNKTDLGTEANDSHGKQCYNFIQGKCKWGASCRFRHSVPDKADIVMEGNETHAEQLENIRGDKAVHRSVLEREDQTFKHKSVPGECYDFIHGKCNFGSNCRFLHSVPDKTDLVPDKADIVMEGNETDGEQLDKAAHRECSNFIQGKCNGEGNGTLSKQCNTIRRDKSEPRGCHAFIQGKCNWGATCRFLHSLPDKTDLGTEGKETHGKQCGNIKTENAVPRVCSAFIQRKCNSGASCRFLHSAPDKNRTFSFHNRYYQDVPSSLKKSDDCREAQSLSFNEHGRYKALPEVCSNYSGILGRYKAMTEVCRSYTQGRCHRGSDCPYLHQEPDMTGPGSTHKSLPELCKYYSQGRCHNGSNCRFLHREPGMSVGSGSTSQHGKPSRFKVVPELCRNNIQGGFHHGSDHRYLHQEQGLSFGLGCTAQFGETRRYQALPQVCRNYIQGRCHKGWNCQYLHQESRLTTGSVFTHQFAGVSRFKALPEVCRNYAQGSRTLWQYKDSMIWNTNSRPRQCVKYTQGKCWRGVDCRYLHHESDRRGSSRFYGSHQRDEDVPLNPMSVDSCVDGESILHETSVHENTESGIKESHQRDEDVPLNPMSVDSSGDAESILHENTESGIKELIREFPVIDEKRDTVEALPNQPIDGESFREAPIILADDAKDLKHLGNVGDSDPMILDAGNICHETSVHEISESGTKELIPHFPCIEEKRDAVEALPNHPIDSDSFQKDFAVSDDTKDEKVPENVDRQSMDNLGESDQMVQDADKQPD